MALVRRDGGCVVCTVVTVQRAVYPPPVCVLLTSPQPRSRDAANKNMIKRGNNPRQKNPRLTIIRRGER